MKKGNIFFIGWGYGTLSCGLSEMIWLLWNGTKVYITGSLMFFSVGVLLIALSLNLKEKKK